MKKKTIINIVVTCLITIGFILLGAFVFRSSYLRFGETIVDFALSIKYYFCYIFNIENTTLPTVGNYSKVLFWKTFLPDNFDSFKVTVGKYFSLLFSGENFSEYGKTIVRVLMIILKVLAVGLPVLLLLFIVIRIVYKSSNIKYGKDTKPLLIWKKTVSVVYQYIKRITLCYISFLKENSWIYKIWIVLWIFHLNFASIVIGFLAYYFYFAASFDFLSMYVQFVKLLIDLQVVLKNVPIWLYLIIGFVIFDNFRKIIARRRLQHFEARNCGFINELPIVSMECGSMGTKKTTMITDMALSQEVMFRQKAFEIIQQNDMKFPFFPWILFEKELQRCMYYGTVYNFATVKSWIAKKRSRFEKHLNVYLQLYGYDIGKYGYSYDNGIKISVLWDVLETYAQAYLVYVIESSLIVSNYSIRTDGVLVNQGNFPMWVNNFFPKRISKRSRHSHILDFDVLRLGRKVLENNPNAGSFEFGIIAITEIGKERGNNLELQEKKKSSDQTNQKNDKFNAWLKMCRHSATVDGFPFIKVFTDEQRPESWGADARDLCDIVHIISGGELKLAIPFYTIGDMIVEVLSHKFFNLYYDFRFRRGDNTLFVYLLKAITVFFVHRNIKIYNRYGYSIAEIEKERGTMDGKTKKMKYYLMNHKIYSKRFATDCFSDYFNDLASRTKVSLNDYREYLTECATVEELRAQNSYFINGLYGLGGDS